MNNKWYWIFLLVIFNLVLRAQDKNVKINRTYATQFMMHKNLLDTAYERKKAIMEKEIYEFKINGKFQNIRIPVVFHMLYDPNVNEKDDNEIYRQLEVITEDYGTKAILPVVTKALTLEGFDKKIARLDLEFCIADGNGQNKSPSINWVPVGSKKWTCSDSLKSKATGGVDPWDTDQYLNVWVCNMIGDTAGFAQMPGGASKTDGIVIDFKFFGTSKFAKPPYNKGKTLSHLIGSYLGLYELWNDYSPCSDDNVSDTPIHNAPNYGVAQVYKHISLCDGNPVEMNMNIMDNSDDESLFLLTEGQKYRIQSVLSNKGLRKNLSKGNSKCAKNPLDNFEIEQRNSDISLPINLSLIPNPAGDDVKIKFDTKRMFKEQLDVVIYDEVGKLISNYKFLPHVSGEYLIDVRNMPNGKYILNIKTGSFKASEVLVVSH